jgi:uncharacterized protein (DUF433 family)
MAKEVGSYRKRIAQTPEVMVGKPVVRGTRIPVELVLGKFAHDLDLDELFAAYPELEIDDVKAVLMFARDLVEADYRRSRRRQVQATAAKA